MRGRSPQWPLMGLGPPITPQYSVIGGVTGATRIHRDRCERSEKSLRTGHPKRPPEAPFSAGFRPQPSESVVVPRAAHITPPVQRGGRPCRWPVTHSGLGQERRPELLGVVAQQPEPLRCFPGKTRSRGSRPRDQAGFVRGPDERTLSDERTSAGASATPSRGRQRAPGEPGRSDDVRRRRLSGSTSSGSRRPATASTSSRPTPVRGRRPAPTSRRPCASTTPGRSTSSPAPTRRPNRPPRSRTPGQLATCTGPSTSAGGRGTAP